jgi:hypothetical protein
LLVSLSFITRSESSVCNGVGPAALAPRSREAFLEELRNPASNASVHSVPPGFEFVHVLDRDARIQFEEIVAGFDRELDKALGQEKEQFETLPQVATCVAFIVASSTFCRYRRSIRLDEHASAFGILGLRSGLAAMNGLTYSCP